jgi:hypothetical protein
LNTEGNKATGNALEKALQKCDRQGRRSFPFSSITVSVADPDLGSGAFLPLDPGSGMGKKMNIADYFSESVESIFGLKTLKFLMRIRIWDP